MREPKRESKPKRESRRRLSARGRARLSWWLPPVLAALAILFQWGFDVPKAEMLPRPTKAEKKAADAAKAKERRRLNKERKRKSGKSGRWQGRPRAEVAGLRRKWSTQAIDDEPVDPRFRKHHEAVLRSAVTKVRTKALDGAKPIAVQIRPACHTIRCTLELCGPRSLVEDIAQLLPEVRVEPPKGTDGPLFLELREVESASQSARSATKRDYGCRQWLLSFDRDSAQIRDLRI